MSQPGIPASTLPEEPLLDHVLGLATRTDGVDDLVKYPVPGLHEYLQELLLADINAAIAIGVEARTAGAGPNILYASTAEALSNGVAKATSLVGGSGGTNGSFEVAFSGGGGTGAAARFTVAGGALIDIFFTARGKNYTSAPTMSFAASAGLTGASAVAVISQNQPAGSYFYVYSSGDDVFILYENVAGSAVERGRVPTKSFLVANADLAKAWASQPENENVAGAPTGSRSALHQALKAAASAALGEKWASENEDVVVASGKFSSLHYARKAEGFAGTATSQVAMGAVQLAAATTERIAAQQAASVAATQAALAGSAAVGNQPLKAVVDLATTTPFNGVPSGLVMQDGKQTVAGMRVLDWNNTDPTVRGIRIAAVGAWPRATDADSAAKLAGMVVIVKDGNEHFGRQFNCISTPVTLGTDPVLFRPVFEGGRNSMSMARQAEGVFCQVGDSNTIGQIGNWLATQRHRFDPHIGPWRKWAVYRMATSGMAMSAVAASIASGNRSASPIDYNPGNSTGVFDGNIWRAINALNLSSNSILELSLFINDKGLGPGSRQPGGPGDPVVMRRNMRNVIFAFLAMTDAQINLVIPQPFAGEDFVLGGTNNLTDWAADSPDGTIVTGAAAASADMIAAYREWIGRNPRVEVIDMPRLVYGADRCDNKLTDCLDRQIGASHNGVSIPIADRRLIFDSLHASNIAKRREEEVKMRHYGLDRGGRPSVDDYFVVGTLVDWTKVYAGELMFFEDVTNSAGNTLLRVRASPEHLFWRGKQASVLFGTTGYTLANDALAEGERGLFMKQLGALRRLLDDYRGQIRVWFPATRNTYTITDIQLSTTVVDTDPYAEPYFILSLLGANMASELAPATGPEIGYTGNAASALWRRICMFYVEQRDFIGNRWNIDLKIPGGKTLDSAPVWMTDVNNEFRIARNFRSTRTDNSVPTMEISLRLANSADGNFSQIIMSKNGCSISGNDLTTPDGNNVLVGMMVTGTGVATDTYIVSGSGTAWKTSGPPQTVGPVSMNFVARYAPASVKAGCSISGNTLTTPDGVGVAIGDFVVGEGVSPRTITAGSGTSWTLNGAGQTAGPVAMLFGQLWATANGMNLGRFVYSSGLQTANLTPNHTNINFMIASGVWQGAANSGWVTLQHNTYLRVAASAAPTEGATVVITN